MQLEKLDVTLLRPAPYNPRIELKPGDPAWEKLARSLHEFELVQPIVWNRQTGFVVAGHQRLAVLKAQGVTEIECVIVDLPLEKEKALNVTLNNSAVASDWDADRLLDLVSELQDLPDFDATLTGFDEQQLKDLILVPAPLPIEEEASNDDSNHVRVILEVPVEDWEEVEQRVNDLLADFSAIRVHLRNAQ
ncbi:ParB N-terminal domain-containing protein [Planctomicrobium sp. SH527]|uniref:ParB N-terminal domain-containing protein n=1 Tax=Planctomicrobium sp. SH527 TaxID=3448123 RepID=UPI003F5C2779